MLMMMVPCSNKSLQKNTHKYIDTNNYKTCIRKIKKKITDKIRDKKRNRKNICLMLKNLHRKIKKNEYVRHCIEIPTLTSICYIYDFINAKNIVQSINIK